MSVIRKNSLSFNNGYILYNICGGIAFFIGLLAILILSGYLAFEYFKSSLYRSDQIPIEDAQYFITETSNRMFNGQLHPIVNVIAGARGGGGEKSQYYLLELKEGATLDDIIQRFKICDVTGKNCWTEEEDAYDGPNLRADPYRTTPNWWYYKEDNTTVNNYQCDCGGAFYKELSVILGQNTVYFKHGSFENPNFPF